MLDEEQLDYVNSLKKTHPNVDKETIREALLSSEWTEIEIMEAITLYNNSAANSAPEKKSEENTDEKPKSKPKTDEDEPVVTVRKKPPGKLVSIITALLIILLFIVLVIIGSMVFFQMNLSEIITFLTVDLIDNISAKFQE